MTRRVLFMISSMRSGGSERQTLLLLRHLNRDQFTPELYVTERAGDLLRQVPDDVTIHSFDDTPDSSGFYFPGRVLRQQVRFVRKLIASRSIDVIYDRTFHMTMIAGPAAKSASIPRVSTIVSPPDHALPLVETRFIALKRRRLATAYRQAQAVVAVSQQTADSAQRYYGLATVNVIRNPVDVAQLKQDAAQPAPFERQGEFNIVCVGRMTAEKGHRDLLAALELSESKWAHDRPLCVWLIGDGPLRAELQQRWQSRPRRHRVEFLGVQHNPAPAIAAADAIVLPSHFEGLPNVVLEAMALETPVIATRAGGTVELQRDEPTILWAQPGHPRSLADAIESLVADPASAQTRVKAATRLIQEHHNMQTTIRSLGRLLSGGHV